jgi:preprotein translocase subunit SecF
MFIGYTIIAIIIGMNKRHLHHIWTKLRTIKPGYFLILTILSGLICILGLRANNEHMIHLRDAVYAADKNNTDIEKPLQNLQAYVTTHMNTDLNSGKTSVYPPIQLQNTYDRLAQAQADQLASSNSQLYTEAQHYCEQQDPVDFSGHNRVPCIEAYVQSHSSVVLAQIPSSLYEFAFVSPRWSSDLAGWSLITTALLGLMFVISLVTNWWFKRHVA